MAAHVEDGVLQLIIVNNWMVIEVCRFWPTETLGTAIGCMRAETIGPTFTVVVAGAMPGALAVIIAVPADTPVTGVTTAVAMPARKVTVPGTVAMALLLLIRLISNPPAGACPFDRVSVRVL